MVTHGRTHGQAKNRTPANTNRRGKGIKTALLLCMVYNKGSLSYYCISERSILIIFALSY